MTLTVWKKKLHKHSVLVLFFISFISILGVIRFKGLPLVQFQILAALSIGYLGWAIFYHSLDKSLTLEVVIEYVLTVFLSLIILYGILI